VRSSKIRQRFPFLRLLLACGFLGKGQEAESELSRIATFTPHGATQIFEDGYARQ
jgi:hypothetical protein